MAHVYTRAQLLGRVLSRAAQRYADGGPHLAGAIGFRVLFSIFPLVIVLGGLLGIVVNLADLQTDVVDSLVDTVPLDPEGRETFRNLLEGATGTLTGIGLLGIVGLVWSASGMMGAIRFGLDRAFGVSRRRPFVRGKLLDIGLVFGVGLLIGLALGLAVSARLLSTFASETLARTGLSGVATWLIGLAVPAVLALVAVALLYHLVPASRPPWRAVMPAAAAVGVAYAVLQNLFALYLSYFGNYNAVYGSLGAVIAFLFFVYLSASLFLFGAYAAGVVGKARAELASSVTTPAEPVSAGERVLRVLRGLVFEGDGGSSQRAAPEPQLEALGDASGAGAEEPEPQGDEAENDADGNQQLRS